MQKPMKADELEVEPDLHLDCDVLILEYTIHNAMKLVLDLPATGQKDRDEALIDVRLHLRMVECRVLLTGTQTALISGSLSQDLPNISS
jgi:hypothetical protein